MYTNPRFVGALDAHVVGEHGLLPENHALALTWVKPHLERRRTAEDSWILGICGQ